jgi:hypothetical protein
MLFIILSRFCFCFSPRGALSAGGPRRGEGGRMRGLWARFSARMGIHTNLEVTRRIWRGKWAGGPGWVGMDFERREGVGWPDALGHRKRGAKRPTNSARCGALSAAGHYAPLPVAEGRPRPSASPRWCRGGRGATDDERESRRCPPRPWTAGGATDQPRRGEVGRVWCGVGGGPVSPRPRWPK